MAIWMMSYVQWWRTCLIHSGAGSIRFDSGLFENSARFDTVFPGSTRFGLRFSDSSRLGPVRFGSIPCPVPAGPRINRFVSVRPVRFGFLFLPDFGSFGVWLGARSLCARGKIPKRAKGDPQNIRIMYHTILVWRLQSCENTESTQSREQSLNLSSVCFLQIPPRAGRR